MNGNTTLRTPLRVVGWLVVSMLMAANVGILVYSAGVADPFPAELTEASLAPFTLSPAPASPASRWIGDPGSIAHARLVASADVDPAGVGLLVGDPSRYLGIAVSNEGYVSVWLHEKGTVEHVLPWQPWPHARIGAGTQEIHVEREGDLLTAWVNRERLWSGTVPDLGTDVGVLAEAFERPTEILVDALWRADR